MSPRLIVLGTLAAAGAGLLVVGQPASAVDVCRTVDGVTACAGADPSGGFSSGGVQANTAESVRVYGAFGENKVCIGRVSVDTNSWPVYSYDPRVVYQCY